MRQRALLLFAVLTLLGCAHPFPRPSGEIYSDGNFTARDIFSKVFTAHGGDHLSSLNDVNVALDGEWKFLITRIQPLVTDHRYRVRSEERLLPAARIYAADYQGPAGSKTVFRAPNKTRVFYGDSESQDLDVLASTALTAESFFIFLLGPLGLAPYRDSFQRLDDRWEKGRRYWLIYAEMEPGIGKSIQDEIVLWIDAENHRLYRVHITLEGYRTTQGAHVDVTYRDYIQRGPYLFPSRFHERVRGPIAIDAHTWFLTGLDINRGLKPTDIDERVWHERAREPARGLWIGTKN